MAFCPVCGRIMTLLRSGRECGKCGYKEGKSFVPSHTIERPKFSIQTEAKVKRRAGLEGIICEDSRCTGLNINGNCALDGRNCPNR